VAVQQPPVLDIARLNATQFTIGVNGVAGETIILQTSTDLTNWLPLATNTLVAPVWIYTNTPPLNQAHRFYRAFVPY
jgi:hypothetical protein